MFLNRDRAADVGTYGAYCAPLCTATSVPEARAFPMRIFCGGCDTGSYQNAPSDLRHNTLDTTASLGPEVRTSPMRIFAVDATLVHIKLH